MPKTGSFRERVYRKAFAALDRGIMASKGLTVEAAMNRRKALQAKITEIESEFIPAVAVDDDGAPFAPDEPPPVDHVEPSVANHGVATRPRRSARA